MDFICGLPITPTKKDSLADILPIHTGYSLQKLERLYISEIVRLLGVLISIISNWDPRFTSRFWKKLQWTLGTQLNFSTAFHQQSDGQSK
ncbi:integrase [Gossypium australe]|uniref:Integrase n=1 Tax=Gossypium australe TaxID=47621 RepID=A0A5B6UXP4_9ROSI|nr:integrase [Gossypium australe]